MLRSVPVKPATRGPTGPPRPTRRDDGTPRAARDGRHPGLGRKLGYDIESRVPATGALRFLEVKGAPERRADHHGHAQRDPPLVAADVMPAVERDHASVRYSLPRLISDPSRCSIAAGSPVRSKFARLHTARPVWLATVEWNVPAILSSLITML